MMRHLGAALVLIVVCGWSEARVAVAGEPSPTKGVTADDADFHHRTRATIQDVLADREFSDLQADSNVAGRRLFQWIDSLLNGVASWIRSLPSWLAWGIVVWMVLTLLAILAHLIYTFVMLLGGISPSSHASGRQGEHPGQLFGLRPLEFDAMYAEARRLLGESDWLAATKHFYVAAILWLDRQGCIAFRLSKTNRDYIEELRTQAMLQTGFRGLTGCFESVVYGGQSATMSLAQDMAHGVEDLLHESADGVAN